MTPLSLCAGNPARRIITSIISQLSPCFNPQLGKTAALRADIRFLPNPPQSPRTYFFVDGIGWNMVS